MTTLARRKLELAEANEKQILLKKMEQEKKQKKRNEIRQLNEIRVEERREMLVKKTEEKESILAEQNSIRIEEQNLNNFMKQLKSKEKLDAVERIERKNQ